MNDQEATFKRNSASGQWGVDPLVFADIKTLRKGQKFEDISGNKGKFVRMGDNGQHVVCLVAGSEVQYAACARVKIG